MEDEHKKSLGDSIELFGAAEGGGTKCTTSSKHNDLLTSYINEAGLYDLILLSKKPEARAFRIWLVEEVIPQIRASGSYVERGSQPQTHGPVLTIQNQLGSLSTPFTVSCISQLMSQPHMHCSLCKRSSMLWHQMPAISPG